MAQTLPITHIGNPLLREVAKPLSKEDILSPAIQELIKDMRELLRARKYGVGLAAPQVGVSVALSVIAIKPTPNRPNLEPFDTVIINPQVVAVHGHRTSMWEGCISTGTGDNTLFGKVPRYPTITLSWDDENAIHHEEKLKGFVAHVAQHETDHLTGILFVDRVKDNSSFMLASEYRKYVVKKQLAISKK